MEKSDHEKVLPNMDIGSKKEKKLLTEQLPPERDSDSDTQSDSDSESSESSSSDSSDSDSEYVCTVCDKTFSGYIPLKQHEKGSKHKKAVARKKKAKQLLNEGAEDEGGKESQEFLIDEPFAVCRTCDKQFGGPESYSMHLKSKLHKRKALEASIIAQVKEGGEINVDKLVKLYKQKKYTPEKAPKGASAREADEEGYDVVDTGEYECKACEKTFTGLIPYTQHLVSKIHAKQMGKDKLLHKIVPDANASSELSEISDVSVLSLEDNILVCKVCPSSFSGPENAVLHLKSQKHKKKLEKYLRKLEKKKKKALDVKEPVVSGPSSKEKEDEIQSESEEDDETSEDEDEPTTHPTEDCAVSEKSASKGKEGLLAAEGNVHENLMHEKYKLYSKALHSLKEERGDSK